MTDQEKIAEILKGKNEIRMSDWEREFIDSVKFQKDLSGKQTTKIYDIYNKVVLGA